MSLTRTVALNSIIQVVGRVITTITSLAVIGALTRYLGVAGYGQYTTIIGYVAFLGVLADSGFFWIMLRELSKERADVDKIVSNVLTLRSVLGVIVFTLGGLSSFLIPQYADTIRYGILIISFGWFFTAINSTFVGVFQMKHRMDQAVLTDILGRLVILVGVLFAISTGGTLLTILGAYALGNVTNFVASLVLGRRFAKVRFRYDPAFWKMIALEAWPMGVVIILGTIYFKIDTVMLSLMKSDVDVGIYGAPYKIIEVILTVPTIFLGNVFPVLTRYLDTKDDRLAHLFQRAFDVLLMIAVPIVIGVMLLAKPILAFVVGSAFVTESTFSLGGQAITSTHALQVLILAVGISFFSNLFNYLLVAGGKQRQLILPSLLFVVLNIGANLLIIPSLSYVGAGLSTVLTELAVATVLGLMVYRAYQLRPGFHQTGRILISGLGMGCIVWLLSSNSLAVPLVAGIVSYPVFLWLSGAVTPAFLDSFRRSGAKA